MRALRCIALHCTHDSACGPHGPLTNEHNTGGDLGRFLEQLPQLGLRLPCNPTDTVISKLCDLIGAHLAS